jgi:hypothetical protein
MADEVAENAETKRSVPDLSDLLPWWKRPGWVAGITSILAATVPVTTAVWGLILKGREQTAAEIEKEKQLALQESQQRHAAEMEELKLRHSIQTDFLDRLKSDTERLRTLRMVAATSDDPKFAKWASDERGVIEADAKALQKKIEEQTARAEEALKALANAKDSNKAQGAELARLRANAAQQQLELVSLRAANEAAEFSAYKAKVERCNSVGGINAQVFQGCVLGCANDPICPEGEGCQTLFRACGIRQGRWPRSDDLSQQLP